MSVLYNVVIDLLLGKILKKNMTIMQVKDMQDYIVSWNHLFYVELKKM